MSFGIEDSVGRMFAVPLHSFTADHSQVNLLWLVAPVSGGDKSAYAHVSTVPTRASKLLLAGGRLRGHGMLIVVVLDPFSAFDSCEL